MAKCAMTSCHNEAVPWLVHKYSGKAFCEKCARQINQWNSKEELIPLSKLLEQMPRITEASNG